MTPGRVLVIDWLGRGGIAQTAAEWVTTLRAAGWQARLVTRMGQEVDPGDSLLVARPGAGGRMAWHMAVVHAAVEEIRADPPDVVVIQNYHFPLLEQRVLRVASRTGARSIVVVHNHRAHESRRGPAGLAKLLTRADAVVTHSRFVADRLADLRVEPQIVHHPIAHSVLSADRPQLHMPSLRRCLQFGVFRGRSGKGVDLLVELSSRPTLDSWEFRAAGRGADALIPADRPARLSIRDGFLEPGDLAAEIAAASVILLPYRRATQSGAVVLAQALGGVVMASAVGGIPEQIENGVDGILMDPSASVDVWADTISGLTDDRLAEIGVRAKARAACGHEQFRAAAPGLMR